MNPQLSPEPLDEACTHCGALLHDSHTLHCPGGFHTASLWYLWTHSLASLTSGRVELHLSFDRPRCPTLEAWLEAYSS